MTSLKLFVLAALGTLAAGCVPATANRDGLSTSTAATPPPTAPNPSVGGAAMLSERDVVANASAAPNLTMLVRAVRSAGLAPTLSGPGPFTVFAPTNDAFGRLAPGTVDNLLRAENRASLIRVLNYHVVSGALTAAQLRQRVQAGAGTATLTTVAGDTLTATLENGVVALTDTNGTKSYVETPDVRQSNGVVHVINGVLVPRLG